MLTHILFPALLITLCGLILACLLIIAEQKLLNYGECKITVNNGQKEFVVSGGNSLLSSLNEKGVYLPSACGGRGTCAYCKTKVPDGGGIIVPVEEPYLTREERESNVRLSCQVKIRNDISVEIPEELFRVKKFKGVIRQKESLTYDIIALTIDLVEPNQLDFVAGQYMQLESKQYDGREAVMRAYSISSPSHIKNSLELMIRKVPEGICTTWIFDFLKAGEEVSLSGPYGEFHLTETDRPAVFIAGGSGMAPICSMLRTGVHIGMQKQITYFFGALTQKDLFLVNELREMEKILPYFRFIPALSNEPDDNDWTGDRGLITEVVERHIKECGNFEGYLCGSPGLIAASMAVLQKAGCKREEIYFDKFA